MLNWTERAKLGHIKEAPAVNQKCWTCHVGEEELIQKSFRMLTNFVTMLKLTESKPVKSHRQQQPASVGRDFQRYPLSILGPAICDMCSRGGEIRMLRGHNLPNHIAPAAEEMESFGPATQLPLVAPCS